MHDWYVSDVLWQLPGTLGGDEITSRWLLMMMVVVRYAEKGGSVMVKVCVNRPHTEETNNTAN